MFILAIAFAVTLAFVLVDANEDTSRALGIMGWIVAIILIIFIAATACPTVR